MKNLLSKSTASNVPTLRFQGFSDKWMKMTLQDATSKIADGTHFSPNTSNVGPYKYITSKNIKHGRLDLNEVSYLDEASHRSIYGRCDVKFNDVLLTKDGANTGNVCINHLQEEFSLLSSVAILRSKHNISDHYFLYLLLSSDKGQKIIKDSVSGQAITRITLSKINNFYFYFPKLPEQQKIASFLSAVDSWLDNLRLQKSSLESYKKSIMQKIFSREIRFKDENGKDYPEWKEKKLNEIGDIIGGGTPDTSNSEYWSDEINWFTPTEIIGKYAKNSLRKISTIGLKKSSAKLLPIGTLLFTSRATIGEISIATEPCTTNQGFQSIVVNDQNSNEFFYYWIIFNKPKFIRLANGSTFLEISSKEMKAIKDIFPSLPEQQKIANFLTSIDKSIESKEKEIASAEHWKKGLMQQMFV